MKRRMPVLVVVGLAAAALLRGCGTTPPPAPSPTNQVSAVVDSAGGRVELPASAAFPGGVVLDIPPGAFVDPVTITILVLDDAGTPSAGSLQFVGPSIEINAGGAQPQAPLTLSLSYDPALLPPEVTPEYLSVALYLPEEDAYEDIETSPGDTNSLVATITHFSWYRILFNRYPRYLPVTWYIAGYPKAVPGLTTKQVDAAVDRAFKMWAPVVKKVGIKFAKGGGSSEIRIKWTDKMPVGHESALATTHHDAKSPYPQIISLNHGTADCGVLGTCQPLWLIASDKWERSPDENDIQTTVAHEIGHALVGHALAEDGHLGKGYMPPLMAPQPGGSAIRALEPEDVCYVLHHYQYKGCEDLKVLGLPSGPSPASGASNVSINTDLDWADVPGATSYDVYFGTSDPPPLVGNTVASNWTLDALSYQTTYYWSAVAKADGDETGGSPGVFTTEARPNLVPQITNPSVNGALTQGQAGTVTVSCTATDTDGTVQSVKADLSAIGGSVTQALTHGSGDQWSWSGSVTPPSSGSKTVSFTATDDDGATGIGQASITVATPANAAPQITNALATGSLTQGQAGTVTVSCTATDTDGTV